MCAHVSRHNNNYNTQQQYHSLFAPVVSHDVRLTVDDSSLPVHACVVHSLSPNCTSLLTHSHSHTRTQVVGAVGFANQRLTLPPTLDARVAALINHCWASDAAARPSFAQVLDSLRALKELPCPVAAAAAAAAAAEGAAEGGAVAAVAAAGSGSSGAVAVGGAGASGGGGGGEVSMHRVDSTASAGATTDTSGPLASVDSPSAAVIAAAAGVAAAGAGAEVSSPPAPAATAAATAAS